MEKQQSYDLVEFYSASPGKDSSFKERLKESPWLPSFLITLTAIILIFLFTMIGARVFEADFEARQQSLDELIVLRAASVEIVDLKPEE